MVFMLCTIAVRKYSTLCLLEVSSLNENCRQEYYASLELPPADPIDCPRIIRGDVEAIDQALIDRVLVKKRQAPITEEQYLRLTKDCKMYKKIRKFITFPLSKKEEDFPIAYSMVVHDKIDMFERLLRAIYAPQNIYCVHVDDKSPDIFKEAVRAITNCFDNVFVASKLEKVVYASWSRVQADLNCMGDLLNSKVKWKYLLNTCGTDFPLKTNAEIVKALHLLQGKNSMESEKTPEGKIARWTYHFEVDTDIHETDTKKSPPPDNVKMFSGNAYIAITRDFVKSLFNNPQVKKIIEWEKDTYSPDEHLWATLNRMPGVPGSVPSHQKYDTSDLLAIARLVKWQDHVGNVNEGAPYSQCTGTYQRGICIYGVGDLPWIVQQHHLFANKFDSLVDNNAIQCLEQYLRHKALYGEEP
ncbi:beta-1,3-galactosyl-O-glycosyl-glycoprotein beta-1,6-N-acetylglucosaminyltransferase 3-like [Spea bombifrons]|uniref:beta-1,3-galactosyl-O-glycosyl-glycoprotein beta-1,6-N-acetylglucosaminyltransferase 3-like n=1 Tax=Spea bombifrons TaxID=233779 RepID=UPI00234A498D|nr:beta-1,3-galactosyl-O-glycosyl-glycoprotein beta-1,6-N-acetylglucosaminyltransferase 3-like [Spea bombifrons]